MLLLLIGGEMFLQCCRVAGSLELGVASSRLEAFVSFRPGPFDRKRVMLFCRAVLFTPQGSTMRGVASCQHRVSHVFVRTR